MAKGPKVNSPSRSGTPKSLAVAERGTGSVQDFMDQMDAVKADCIGGRLTTQQVNAVSSISGKQLRMLDLAYKYGQLGRGKGFFKRLGA